MNHYLEAFTDCPCCGFPAESAYSLFKTLQYGKHCSVLRCQHCSLIFKELAPTDSGLAKIYTSEYIHFNTGSHAPELPEVYSAEIKLARCQKLLKNRPQPKDLRLLDIGCGDGEITEYLISSGFNVYGVELNERSVAKANKKYPKRFFHGDILEMSFAKEFQAIYFNQVIEHIVKPYQFMVQLSNCLDENGIVVFATLNAGRDHRFQNT